MAPAPRRGILVMQLAGLDEDAHGGGLGQKHDDAADRHERDLPRVDVDPPHAPRRAARGDGDPEADDELHCPDEGGSEEPEPREELRPAPHTAAESCVATITSASTLTKCQ